jgi:hypothetical protein
MISDFTGYRFGYNGQERDNELAGDGNAFGAEFWEYDPRVARRYNTDPKPFASISLYACFLNSPVIFNDVLGDVIGGDKKKVEEVKKAAADNIEQLDKQISELGTKIDARGSKGATKAQTNELERLISKKTGFKKTQREIKAMEESSTTYNIVTVSGREGETSYNPETKAIDIVTNGSIGITVHELKHGYQFETGEISFLSGGASGNLADIGDEVEAYKRQYLFDPGSIDMDAIVPANVRLLKDSKGRQPYLNLPSERLSKMSNVGQVFKAVGSSVPPACYSGMPYGEYVKTGSLPEIIK